VTRTIDVIARNGYKVARAIELLEGLLTHPWQVRRCSGRGSPRSGYADAASVSSDTPAFP